MTVLFGLLGGLALGLTPFGGGLLFVSLSILGLGLAPGPAVALALSALALAAAVGAGDGTRSRALETGPAVPATAGAAAGALLGAWVLGWLPASLWATAYAAACLAAAAALWFGAGERGGTGLRAGLLLGAPRLPAGRQPVTVGAARGLGLGAGGVAAGAVGGVLGGGGGLLLVPLLARLGGLDRRRVLAGSLLALTALGVFGAAGAWTAGYAVDWNSAGLFLLGAVAGFGFARRLAPRLGAGVAAERTIGISVAAAGGLAAAVVGF